jgi:transcriptional regulator with XRE-family HTH domain
MARKQPKYRDSYRIGQRIHRLRKQWRMSGEELAKRSHLSQQEISAIEGGQVRLSIEIARQIAEALGVRWEALLLGDAEFEHLTKTVQRDYHTLAVSLAQACAEAPDTRVPLALSLFAAQLQAQTHARREPEAAPAQAVA